MSARRGILAAGVLLAGVGLTSTAAAQIEDGHVFRPHPWGEVHGGVSSGYGAVPFLGVHLGGSAGYRVAPRVSVVVPVTLGGAYLLDSQGGTGAVSLRGGAGVEFLPVGTDPGVPRFLLRGTALVGTYACIDAVTGGPATSAWCDRLLVGGDLHLGYLWRSGMTLDGGSALEFALELGARGTVEPVAWSGTLAVTAAAHTF